MKHATPLELVAMRLLYLGFFLPMKVQAACLAICMIFLVSKRFQRPTMGQLAAAFGLGSVFILCLAAAFVTPHSYARTAWRFTETRAGLFLLPLLMACLQPGTRAQLAAEKRVFAYAGGFTALAANAAFAIHAASVRGSGVVLNHVYYRQYMEKLLELHPTYLSMYLAMGLLVLLVEPAQGGLAVLHKIIIYLLTAWLLALMAKSPVLALLLALVHTGWLERRRLASLWKPLTGAVALVALSYVFVPFFSQRVNEMVQFRRQPAALGVHDNSLSERVMISGIDRDALRAYGLTGVGPGRMPEMLRMHYFFYSLSHGLNSGYYDPHSAYLWEWLSYGIFGLLLLSACWLAQGYIALRSGNRLYLYLLLLVGITACTESVITRQQGVLFFGFFTALFFFNTPARPERIT